LFQSARDYAGSGPVIAYSNSDIVHSTTLLPALDAIKREYWSFMAIGCRTNVRYNPATEELDMSTATRHSTWAIDYFVMPKSSRLVGEIPAFLIGSTRFDNWIVMKGWKDPEMAVIDITEAHTVLHPYPAENVLRSSADRDGLAHNGLLAGPDFRLGNIAYSDLMMTPDFHILPNPGHHLGVEMYRNFSASWALQYETEILTGFKRYLSIVDSVYYVVALMHPTISRVAGISIDNQKMQKLIRALEKPEIAIRSVYLTPSTFLGKRAWTFQEVLEKVLGKTSVVTENMPCSEDLRAQRCWVQRSKDASLLIVDNSEELMLQHPSIYETLRADPSLLLLTRVTFEHLLMSRSDSPAFKQMTAPGETDILTMLKKRSLGCIYALPPEHVELSDSWDSESPNLKQDLDAHRFSIKPEMLRDGVQKWSTSHAGGSITFLCFPYRSIVDATMRISSSNR
jgi:hypothetical protein